MQDTNNKFKLKSFETISRLSQSVFRTKTSSDNKVCKERKHRIRLLILGVCRVGIKKHSEDNEKKKYGKNGRASPG